MAPSCEPGFGPGRREGPLRDGGAQQVGLSERAWRVIAAFASQAHMKSFLLGVRFKICFEDVPSAPVSSLWSVMCGAFFILATSFM